MVTRKKMLVKYIMSDLFFIKMKAKRTNRKGPKHSPSSTVKKAYLC